MKYPRNPKLAKSIGRMLPVRRSGMTHKALTDYDRRDSKRAIEEQLEEEDDMEKDYTRAEAMAEKILDLAVKDGVHAARIVRSKPPVVEVFGVTEEVLKITVDVE